MSQLAMVIDLNRCVGCHACAIACRAEWSVPVPYKRNWVKSAGPEKTPKGMAFTFYPGLCNHCDEPKCTTVCPADPEEREFKSKDGKVKKIEIRATYKDPFTGAVLIDKSRCIGCGACVEACPYGARYLNEELDDPKADKCTFCTERLEHGLEPACVRTCISGARIFGDLSDKNSSVSKLIKDKGAIRLVSEKVNIGPNVYYIGKEKDLYLLKKKFAPTERTWENVMAPVRRNILISAFKSLKVTV